MNTTKIYFDGGYNQLYKPPFYIGFYVEDKSNPTSIVKKVNLAVASSCEVEYYALVFTLGWLLTSNYRHIHLMNDNETLVRQIQGSYRVHIEALQNLKLIADALWVSLLRQGKILHISHIKRELNKADKPIRKQRLQDNRGR